MARILNGTVVSDKADKTITVAVRSSKTHPIYKKKYTVIKRFLVHDQANDASVSDKVSIIETRPISSRKHFKLEKIIEKAVLKEEQSVKAVTEDDVEPVKNEKTSGETLRQTKKEEA